MGGLDARLRKKLGSEYTFFDKISEGEYILDKISQNPF